MSTPFLSQLNSSRSVWIHNQAAALADPGHGYWATCRRSVIFTPPVSAAVRTPRVRRCPISGGSWTGTSPQRSQVSAPRTGAPLRCSTRAARANRRRPRRRRAPEIPRYSGTRSVRRSDVTLQRDFSHAQGTYEIRLFCVNHVTFRVDRIRLPSDVTPASVAATRATPTPRTARRYRRRARCSSCCRRRRLVTSTAGAYACVSRIFLASNWGPDLLRTTTDLCCAQTGTCVRTAPPAAVSSAEVSLRAEQVEDAAAATLLPETQGTSAVTAQTRAACSAAASRPPSSAAASRPPSSAGTLPGDGAAENEQIRRTDSGDVARRAKRAVC